jgi:uncharacterized protein (DUF362 family)
MVKQQPAEPGKSERVKVGLVHHFKPSRERIRAMTAEVIELSGGLGGLLHPGDTVAIKINLYAPLPPPVTVDRRVAAAMVGLLRQAGAGRVIVAEAVSVGTRLERGVGTSDCFRILGVQSEIEAAGGEVLCLENDRRVSLPVPGGLALHQVDYPRTFYEADLVVNLTCMKTHTLTLLTLGIKNFQGLLSDVQKYRAHRDDLDQKLVDIHKVRRADLTLIDGLLGLEGDGPGEKGRPVPMGLLIASRDTVAADAAASYCMGIDDVLDVTTTRLAQHDGLGVADLNRIELCGASVEAVRRKFALPADWFKPPDRYVLGLYPNVDIYIGGACKWCWIRAGRFAKRLSKLTQERFSIVAGVDPQLPLELRTSLENTILLGDCTVGASGFVNEIRSAMHISGAGLMLPGCPPFRPASAAFERYLESKGLVDPDQEAIKQSARWQEIIKYYQSVDPTWVPKENNAYENPRDCI